MSVLPSCCRNAPFGPHKKARGRLRHYKDLPRQTHQRKQEADPFWLETANMKNKKLNAVHVWKQLEDLAVPRLHLSVFDRAVYSHLLRHSRLEGRLQLRFSILWLARGAGLSGWAARIAVRSLVAKGALRLAERSRAGHVGKVRLPEEIRSLGAGKIAARARVRLPSADNLEKADFLETRAVRQAIHAREGGRCFYCLRRLTPMGRCIDIVLA